MMAVWSNGALMLHLITLHITLLSSQASFGADVKCWWRRVSYNKPVASVECQANPQESTLECNLCLQHVLSFKPAIHLSQTGCSRTSASFSALLESHHMQNTTCTLLCPGNTARQTTLSCIVQEGYPPPSCLVPSHDDIKNIHCNWTGSLNPLIPTNFTLHWKEIAGNRYNGFKDVGESDSGIIPREQYPSHEYIEVWISAVNALGKLNSEILLINTQHIIQPASPFIINHSSDPLEIFWESEAENIGQWHCKVQYKKQCDQDWTEVEDSYEVSFILEDAAPFTKYRFRVRCRRASDERSVMSDWSPEYIAETPVAAPMGMLDVWSDCDSSSDESSCTVLWKEMPKQQARGNINSYLLTMKLSNGSVLNINGSVYASAEIYTRCEQGMTRKEPPNLVSHAQQSYLRCPQEQSCFHYCHLSIPVKEVKCIGVTVNTAGGESSPAVVALPSTGLVHTAGTLEVRGRSEELNVSWPLFSHDIQEYVVQLKPVGLPHTQCLNWVKVHKNQTFVTLRGPLPDYTAYNVSLFAIVNNRSCLLKSAIAYTVEGVPPKVEHFQAISTSLLSVNLTWTLIPHNMSRGHILHYLVGISNDVDVYKVNSNQSSLQLHNLKPDQKYEVWISANTTAGEGNRTYTIFTTAQSGNITSITMITIFLIMVIIVAVVCCLMAKKIKWINIPDPINSSSFKELSNQLPFWQSLPVRSASMEHGLTISQVEVVPEVEVNHEPEVEQPEEPREHDQSRGKELQGYEELKRNNSVLRRQKEYSQMIDSSDEEGKECEEDEWNEEWNEETFPSDYEKHFLPCIMGV
ncbi:interleukin 12 receptor, beta 2a, like isoform X2 [Tachysurus vachellii]|nr:interleukin 12 receptor, beta 2a, like isoform X2 [Tachysurus vachellii]